MAYQFHYTPTGTGVISGKEVLEQTEDAINDLSGQISGDVQIAIDTANNALNTANTASADAQNAINTANTAYTAATNAQNTANTAQNTASNALTAAQNAQNDVNALGNRVTTAENNISQNTSDISGLTTRMGTAEGNIGNLQTAVSNAQATANSAQQTAATARQQSYVFRYSSTALTPSSTNSNALLDNTDNLKVGDKVIDSSGVLFSITAIDTQNSTFTIGTALIDLAQDSDVMHLSGNETVAGIKTFSEDTFIKSLNFTREVPSQSSSASSILPITAIITYGDSSPSAQARLNLRITADGIKSLYPHENNQYSLGLTSRRFKDFYTYLVNGINPGALSLPDLNNGIDISGYLTPGNSNNTYTPLVDGYVSVNIGIASGGCAVFLSQGDLYNACYSATGAPDVTGVSAWCMLPVKGGVQMNIGLKGGNNYINSAKFYPNLGNV